MIVMALAALGPVMLNERLFVFAAVKQTRIGRMAETATTADLRNAGRAGSVIAMASVARGRTEITTDKQRPSMYAVAIFGELRCRQLRAVRARKPCHNLRIAVACATRFRH